MPVAKKSFMSLTKDSLFHYVVAIIIIVASQPIATGKSFHPKFNDRFLLPNFCYKNFSPVTNYTLLQ